MFLQRLHFEGFHLPEQIGPLGGQIPQTWTMPSKDLSLWLNSWWNWTWSNLTTKPESWTTSLISSSSVGNHSLLRGALWEHKFWIFQCQQQQRRQRLKEGGMITNLGITETCLRKSSKEGVSLHQQVVAIPPFQAQLIVPTWNLPYPHLHFIQLAQPFNL